MRVNTANSYSEVARRMFRSPRLLVAARVLAGMSQPELAAAAGIATSVLQGIEQGTSDPRLSTLLAIVDALKARGVEFAPETARVAWGVLVVKGGPVEQAASEAYSERLADLKANPAGAASGGGGRRGRSKGAGKRTD